MLVKFVMNKSIIFYEESFEDLFFFLVLSILCGSLLNGLSGLITTAVSADLGNHKKLAGNTKALATVTAVIDGTGSIGE